MSEVRTKILILPVENKQFWLVGRYEEHQLVCGSGTTWLKKDGYFIWLTRINPIQLKIAREWEKRENGNAKEQTTQQHKKQHSKIKTVAYINSQT